MNIFPPQTAPQYDYATVLSNAQKLSTLPDAALNNKLQATLFAQQIGNEQLAKQKMQFEIDHLQPLFQARMNLEQSQTDLAKSQGLEVETRTGMLLNPSFMQREEHDAALERIRAESAKLKSAYELDISQKKEIDTRTAGLVHGLFGAVAGNAARVHPDVFAKMAADHSSITDPLLRQFFDTFDPKTQAEAASYEEIAGQLHWAENNMDKVEGKQIMLNYFDNLIPREPQGYLPGSKQYLDYVTTGRPAIIQANMETKIMLSKKYMENGAGSTTIDTPEVPVPFIPSKTTEEAAQQQAKRQAERESFKPSIQFGKSYSLRDLESGTVTKETLSNEAIKTLTPSVAKVYNELNGIRGTAFAKIGDKLKDSMEPVYEEPAFQAYIQRLQASGILPDPEQEFTVVGRKGDSQSLAVTQLYKSALKNDGSKMSGVENVLLDAFIGDFMNLPANEMLPAMRNFEERVGKKLPKDVVVNLTTIQEIKANAKNFTPFGPTLRDPDLIYGY